VDQIVEEALAFPHKQSLEAFQAEVDLCLAHDTADRLSHIAAPTLVVARELDVILPPRFGRFVADAIPNARFDVIPGEAHQPSRRCRTTSTPASTPSGARSRREHKVAGASGREGARSAWTLSVSTSRPRRARLDHE
jgi:hypothetical protein